MSIPYTRLLFTINASLNIDPERAYELMRNSYEKATGASWSREKTLRRLESWELFGDQNGFVAVRPQRGGWLKLVAAAGAPKSIIKGVLELQARDIPIWGMMDRSLVDHLKKIGYIEPPAALIKLIVPTIPRSVFGGVPATVNNDGSVTLQYHDVGDATKFFVANLQYYRAMIDMIQTRPDVPPAIKIAVLPMLRAIVAGNAMLNKLRGK